MTISLTSEQERVLASAIEHGLARNPDEALDKALDSLREGVCRKFASRRGSRRVRDGRRPPSGEFRQAP